MTISTTTSSVTYQGNGATTVFTFPFVADNSNDIDVYYTDASGNRTLLSSSLYTLTINAVPVGGLWGIGGSVTYPISGTPILAGTSLSIIRAVPYTQDVSISNQGAFYPQAVEQGLDVLELQIQQIENDSGRAVRVPVTDTGAQTILPSAVQRESQLIGFDGTGENVQMYPTSAVPGPIAFLSQTVTHAMSPYTASNANVLFVNASGGNVVINLPTASPVKQYFVSRVDSSYLFTVTVNASSGQTILGASSFTGVQYQYQSNVFLSDGVSNWDVTSQFRKTTSTGITNSYVSSVNFFDVVNDPFVIQAIQSGSGLAGGYLDSYMSAAIALGGTIYFPSGDYHFLNTVTMAPGVVFQGNGIGNTVFTTGGTAGQWGFQLLLPNGIQHIEAPKFRDMTIQVLQHGIRWNSATGGFTDDGTSQQYMFRPMLERVNLTQDNTAGTGIGVQMSKCFDFWIQGCAFANFSTSIDCEGSDIGTIINNRFDTETGYSITATSHNTFGSTLSIRDNDFNDPGSGYVNSSYRDILIEGNHMETDSLVSRTNLLNFNGTNVAEIKVHNNRIDNVTAPTNWININSGDTNKYLVSVMNNATIGSVASMGAVSYPTQLYFNNSGSRSIVRAHGNSTGLIGFPMNTDQGDQLPSTPYIVVVGAGSPGVSFVNSTINPICQSGLFAIASNADVTKKMEISDWASCNLPTNLTGSFVVVAATMGDTNGLIGSYDILDGAGSVGSGTITHTVANRIYYTALLGLTAFSTNLRIRFWNADTTHVSGGGRFFVKSCTVSLV